MRKPGGYAFFLSPDAAFMRLDERSARPEQVNSGITEFDTFSCGHCGRVKHVRPRERPEDLGGLCRQCMKFLCPCCVDKGCLPFEKRLEEAERREIALRSYGIN